MVHQKDAVVSDVVECGQLFIGGGLVDPLGDGTIEVFSPHTEQVIGPVPRASRADVDRAVAVARRAFDGGEGAVAPHPTEERIAVVTRIKDTVAAR